MAQIPTSQKKPQIPAPGVLQVEMIYRYLDSIAENVYHVQTNSAGTSPTLTDMQRIADVFENWESTQMIGARTNQCKLQTIRVRDLTVPAGLVYEQTPVSPVTGTVANPPCSGNVAIAVRWGTGIGGRSFRGRTFHLGVVNVQVIGNQLAPNIAQNLTALYAGLRSAVAASAGAKLVVVSYAHNKFWRNTAVSTPITTVSVDNNVDSQRRRLSGRGK